MSARGDAALIYVERAVPVFPVWHAIGPCCACGRVDCDAAAKHPIGPLVPRGFQDATTDLAVIRRWWSRYPDANIATPTTWTVVLDVDPRKGGDVSLAELEARHGALPGTAEVLTGGGGRHVYFAPDPAIACSADRVARGLDVKATGGYVLLPPSNHVSGREYLDEIMHPLFETPLAPMPAWLRELAMRPAPTNGQGPDGTDWGALLAGAPKGERHAVAVRVAGHLLGKRLAAGEVETILLGFAERCAPPFPADEARKIVADLAAKDQAKAPPAAEQARRAGDDGGLGLVSVGELLDEPDDPHQWVVQDRLPVGGLGLLAGKPKAGKSTLARCLALAVARGAPWLGFATRQGPVIYLALEEKRAEVRAHFRAMGATSADPIYVLCASAPEDGLRRLWREAERLQPALIIVDPLFRFVRVPDGNDYATMTAALEPLLVLARKTGACVVLVHHLGKAGQGREDGDTVLGSTAIFGAVDSALLMKRTEKYRTLSSIQRYGGDLEEITVTLDPDTLDVAAGPPRATVEIDEAGRLILAYLAKPTTGAVTEAEIEASVECRTKLLRAGLRALVSGNKNVVRTGRGGKTDPFRYSCSPSIPGTREQE